MVATGVQVHVTVIHRFELTLYGVDFLGVIRFSAKGMFGGVGSGVCQHFIFCFVVGQYIFLGFLVGTVVLFCSVVLCACGCFFWDILFVGIGV